MKLFVAGCSVSDYTKVSKVYGEFLAEKLGCEYVHAAAGCGSNWRIWRTITRHIMNGNLTKDDLLLVQYTGREREEFWTSFAPSPDEMMPNTLEHLCVTDKTQTGHIIRYKAGAGQWQHNPEEKSFFAQYEKYFLDITFEQERFVTHNFMFQNMLKQHQIKTVFVRTIRSPPGNRSDFIPEYLPYVFSDSPIPVAIHRQNDLSLTDTTHMSQKGHEVFAGWLYDHINKLNIKEKE